MSSYDNFLIYFLIHSTRYIYITITFLIYSILKENIYDTIKYVATFWNQVNLIYSKLIFPKIKILITGIMIEEVFMYFKHFHIFIIKYNKIFIKNIIQSNFSN